MADGKVRIRVEDNAKASADNFSKLDRELKDVSKSAKSADKSFINLKNALVGVGSFLAVREVARFGGTLLQAGSDAEETANKFNTVFRDVRDEATLTADEIAKSFGLSSRASQQFLSDTGDLLTGLGFTGEKALEVSDAVTRLAVDLASFTNVEGGATRASSALTSALLGEREAVKSLGIAIGEADIKQLAESKGIVGELDRQQKALLTLELATKQSGNAIGDFARSQDSYANQVRVFQASIENLEVAMGDKLLPTAVETVGTLNDLFNDPEFTDGLTTFADTVATVGRGILEFGALTGAVIDTTKRAIGEIQADSLAEEFGISVEESRNLFALQQQLNEQIDSLNSKGSSGNVFVDLNADAQKLKTTVDEIGSDGFVAKDITELDRLNAILNTRTLEAQSKAREALLSTTELTRGAVEDLSDGLAVGLTTPFKEGETAAERFGNIVAGILQDIARQIIAQQLTGLFTSSLGLTSGGGEATVPLPNAKGNAFENGKVQAFATGGVVSSPTFFPMANGGTGLMGEAGAEAIMPLKRGKGGRLGVEAQVSSPTINVINNSQAQIETVQRPNNEFDIIVREVSAVLSSQRSDGAVSSALARQRSSGVQGA